VVGAKPVLRLPRYLTSLGISNTVGPVFRAVVQSVAPVAVLAFLLVAVDRSLIPIWGEAL
jgi:hypothetical protein